MKTQDRIRRARRQAGFTQASLAELVGVRRSAVSNWESANDVVPSMQHLMSIAIACRVSLEWLGTGRGVFSLEADYIADVPTADAELVDVEEERMLLAAFRDLPRRRQQLVFDLMENLRPGGRRNLCRDAPKVDAEDSE